MAKVPVNILMVDDQPAKLLSYETVLASLGENLIRANSGQEALEFLLRNKVAVVLADVRMPELDGFELATMIRSHPRFRKTAVILVSGVLVEDVDRLRGYDSGAVDYVSVPIVPEILRAKVSVFAELYRKSEELEELNRELENRVAERTAEIERARQEAEQANRLKDEFLATLSHELRTPLNAITGWSHLLLSAPLDDSQRQTAVETIHRNAQVQAQLISELLDVARIVSGKLRLDLESVDLDAVLTHVLDAVRPSADAKNITLACECDTGGESILADRARLQQVVANLVSNAVKFTPAGGAVDVRAARRGGEVEISVRDNGPGIDPEFLPHIFDRFRQGDTSSTRRHQGLGLGLAIVRHLVELHGGRVTGANREDGKGAIFTAILPAARGGEEKLTASRFVLGPVPPPAMTLNGSRILVVDDEPDARELAAHILERSGAEVLVAASAGEAYSILVRERPDVLVADIEMPSEDGYSLVRRIRTLAPGDGGKTIALALTAYAGDQDRAKMLLAGFQGHLAKPVQPPDLVAAIAALTRERSATSAN